MDTGGFVVYMKTEDIYSIIAKCVKTRFDTSNYEFDRPLPKGKNKKVIGLVKNELRGKVMTELKMHSYLTYSTSGNETPPISRVLIY